MIQALPLAHAASTLFMTGLIWFVQLVHYPLFLRVGEAGFATYAAQHARRTTWVVLPLMLLEAATALMLVGVTDTALSWVGLGLLGLIWASTAALQVPCHTRLQRGFDRDTARRLVRSNWVRTVAWSCRSVVALLILAA